MTFFKADNAALMISVNLLLGGGSGFLGAYFFSRPFFATHFLDIPNSRSSHVCATPKGGGVGIVIGVTIAAVILGISKVMILCWLSVSTLGLFSDRFDFSPLFRLLFQITVALSLVFYWYLAFNTSTEWAVEKWPLLSYFSSLEMSKVFIVMAVVMCGIFIVATVNIYNFMDGINGIAALSGGGAFLLILLFKYSNSQLDPIAGLCVVVIGATVGFLPMNFPNAQVFMGDVGSLFLGFLYATVVLNLSESIGEVLVFASFLSPFYFDELTTMVIRLKSGENLFHAHRKHLYQILVNERANSHLKVTILYAIVQFVSGILMISLYAMDHVAILAEALGLLFILFSFFSWKVRQGAELPFLG